MNEIRSLTSLRGLAALYVALLHFSARAEQHCVTTIPALAPRGHLAVDFFFVLSGFIMAYTYAQDFARFGAAQALPSFLVKRMARILPLHWFITFLVFAYTLLVAPDFATGEQPAFKSAQPIQDLILNLLLLQGVGLAPNMNGPSWSISVEMFAYLSFPVFLLFFANPRKLLRWIAAAAAAGALIWTALQRPRLSLDSESLGIQWTLLRCFAEFGLGIIAHHWYSSGIHVKRMGSDSVVAALSLVAASMMLLRLWDIVAVLAFPAIVVAVAHNRGIAARILGHRFFYFLGVISFSLYLIHSPIAYLELHTLGIFHPELVSKPVAMVLAALGAFSVIPLAWATYELVERPGRTVLRSLGERLRRNTNTAASP